MIYEIGKGVTENYEEYMYRQAAGGCIDMWQKKSMCVCVYVRVDKNNLAYT